MTVSRETWIDPALSRGTGRWIRRGVALATAALFVVGLALVLGGCAEEYVAMRPGVMSFDEANGECFYRANVVANPYAQRPVYVACMRGRGWRPK